MRLFDHIGRTERSETWLRGAIALALVATAFAGLGLPRASVGDPAPGSLQPQPGHALVCLDCEPELDPPSARLGPIQPLDVHISELRLVKRVDPVYPRVARRLALGHQRCLAELAIDPRGRVHRVDVRKCAPAFHQATRDAVLQWTFEPVMSRRGESVAVRTIVGLTFKQ